MSARLSDFYPMSGSFNGQTYSRGTLSVRRGRVQIPIVKERAEYFESHVAVSILGRHMETFSVRGGLASDEEILKSAEDKLKELERKYGIALECVPAGGFDYSLKLLPPGTSFYAYAPWVKTTFKGKILDESIITSPVNYPF